MNKKFVKFVTVILIGILCMGIFSACTNDMVETVGLTVEEAAELAEHYEKEHKNDHDHADHDHDVEDVTTVSDAKDVENKTEEDNKEGTEENNNEESTPTVPVVAKDTSDKSDNTEVTNNDEQHTHTYGNPEWSWVGYRGASAKFTCGTCGDTKTLACTNPTSSVTKEATTTSTGTRVYTASVEFNGKSYKNTKTETIPKKENTTSSSEKPSTTAETWGDWDWTSWKTKKAATCTTTGIQERTGTRKSNKGNTQTKTEERTVEKIDHTSDGGKVTKEATTTTTGVKTYTCTQCGKTIKTETIPKKTQPATPTPTHTHSYGSWTTTKNATCTADGTQERKCSCGKTETKSIPSTGHSYGNWSLSGSNQVRKCTKCGNQETKEAGKRWVVDVPYQAAIYNDQEIWKERTVWWVTYSTISCYEDPEKFYSHNYDLTEKFYSYDEYMSFRKTCQTNHTMHSFGQNPEYYVDHIEQVLVTPEVPEQGHWEYFVQ